jgi:hypothetical protein
MQLTQCLQGLPALARRAADALPASAVPPPAAARARAALLASTAALAAVAALASAAALAADAPSGAAPDPRFYAGLSLARVSFDHRYAGVDVGDVSTGFGVYVGARLREPLSLELSFDRSDAIDRSGIAGSGVVRFDLQSERRTAALSVVREVSLQDLFEWPRDWRVFGSGGIYRSEIDTTATSLGSGATSHAADRIDGVVLGMGFVKRIAKFELRGHVRKFGVLDGSEALETEATVQLRF